MHILAFMNQKGGVAKTTTTLNVGAALQKLKKKVLLVDMDPQANLTKSLGIHLQQAPKKKGNPFASYPEHTIYHLLTGKSSFKQCVIETKGLKVIPSSIMLSGGEIELSGLAGRELLLREALEEEAKRFDYVLLDCPPALGLLSLNAMAAATQIVIVLKTEYLALEGMSDLLKTVEVVKKRLNPALEILGIVATMFHAGLKLHQESLEKVSTHFPELLLATLIRQNVALAEAPSHGMDIFSYKADSYGAEDYMNLGKELMERAPSQL